ncbi:phenylacetate--CoA ligase family protein [Haladaptatus sp. NG-SE-30]
MAYDSAYSLTRTDIRERQAVRLRRSVEHAYENVPQYRRRFDDVGLSPSDIDGVEAISRLPFTTKSDFRDTYPDGLFAVERDEIRRFHASSGTTGKPKIVAYTDSDLDTWADLTARTLSTAGVSPGQTVQNAAGYGLFTGGLGFHAGIERLGCAAVPTGAGNTARQLRFIRDLDVDALVTIPSYALYLAETADERGIDPRDLTLSSILVGAEPSTPAMRAEIEERFDATVTENYGLSELMGPGIATECAEVCDGMHLWEDHFYPEIVDPSTGDVLSEGEEGELVLTALSKVALPVLRYRTGDIGKLTRERCACGRTYARLSLTGRSDDLLVVRGVNVYPGQIESVILEFDAVAPQYRIDLRTESSLDTLELTVEHEPGTDATDLADRLRARLRDVLQLTPDEVRVVEPGTIDRTEVGKAKRIYDHR